MTRYSHSAPFLSGGAGFDYDLILRVCVHGGGASCTTGAKRGALHWSELGRRFESKQGIVCAELVEVELMGSHGFERCD